MRAERPAGGARVLAMSLNESGVLVEGLNGFRASRLGWSYVVGSVVAVGSGSGFTGRVTGGIAIARGFARQSPGRRAGVVPEPSIVVREKAERTTAIQSA